MNCVIMQIYCLLREESEMASGWGYKELLGKTMGKSIGMLQKALEKKINVFS